MRRRCTSQSCPMERFGVCIGFKTSGFGLGALRRKSEANRPNSPLGGWRYLLYHGSLRVVIFPFLKLPYFQQPHEPNMLAPNAT